MKKNTNYYNQEDYIKTDKYSKEKRCQLSHFLERRYKVVITTSQIKYEKNKLKRFKKEKLSNAVECSK